MRFLIMLEQTKTGFSAQAPDLAIVTHGETLQDAKRAALQAFGSTSTPIAKPE